MKLSFLICTFSIVVLAREAVPVKYSPKVLAKSYLQTFKDDIDYFVDGRFLLFDIKPLLMEKGDHDSETIL